MPASPLEPYHFSNLAPAAHRSGRSIWSSLSIYTTMKAAAYKLFYPLMAHDRCVLKRDNALNDVVGCPALAFVACSTHIKMIWDHSFPKTTGDLSLVNICCYFFFLVTTWWCSFAGKLASHGLPLILLDATSSVTTIVYLWKRIASTHARWKRVKSSYSQKELWGCRFCGTRSTTAQVWLHAATTMSAQSNWSGGGSRRRISSLNP